MRVHGGWTSDTSSQKRIHQCRSCQWEHNTPITSSDFQDHLFCRHVQNAVVLPDGADITNIAVNATTPGRHDVQHPVNWFLESV